ncbi:MAG: hypothetical protein ABSC06_26805 [Rhodopila sp.]
MPGEPGIGQADMFIVVVPDVGDQEDFRIIRPQVLLDDVDSSPNRRLNEIWRSFERRWLRNTTTMLSWNASSISLNVASSMSADRSVTISAPSAASLRITGSAIWFPPFVFASLLEEQDLADRANPA